MNYPQQASQYPVEFYMNILSTADYLFVFQAVCSSFPWQSPPQIKLAGSPIISFPYQSSKLNYHFWHINLHWTSYLAPAAGQASVS